jgi:hypothetical protein
VFDVSALLRAVAAELRSNPELRRELQTLLASGTKLSPTDPIYLAPAKFAIRLGVSRRLVFTWLSEGLPSLGSGRGRRIPVAEGERWLEARASGNRGLEVAARNAALRAIAGGRR